MSTTNKLITDTMENAARIMDDRITMNQSIIDTLVRSPMDSEESIAMIDALRKDNEDMVTAIDIISMGRKWI